MEVFFMFICYCGFMILILLITVFFLEIAAFVEIGGELGVLATLLIIVLSAMFGMGRLRYYTAYIATNRGEDKQQLANHLFHGICGVIAGFFLIIPGFVTDILGLILLVPFVRTFLRAFILDTIIGSYTFGIVGSDDLHDMKNYYKKETTKKSEDTSIVSHKKGKGKVVDADFEIVDKDAEK
ncbi:MAG: UPF0716 family protein affecting phage T7 exclusion [Alphaproteobacteria bacterium]|jgi:UPF0716 family protein affecting phage T7 exclusion